MPNMHLRLGLCAVATLLGGCLFGSTTQTRAAMREEAKATTARQAAVQAQNFPEMLAYDDVFLARSGVTDVTQREARKRHFASWLESEVSKLGPPTTANLDALFGTLVAFRRESKRAAGPAWLQQYKKGAANMADDPSVSLRSQDLSMVDATLITPRLAELAPAMWLAVDAAAQAGNLAGAIQRGRAIVSELAADSAQAVALAQLERRASTMFLDQARAAGDEHAGARVLYADLATMLGASREDVGSLDTPSDELLVAIGSAWKVAVDGNCGDTVNIDGDRSALAGALPSRGWRTTSVQDVPILNVRFTAACPLIAREWQTQEEMPYLDVRKVTTREPVYEERCMPNVYKEDRKREGDILVTTKWIEPAECHDEIVGSEDVTVTLREPKTELVTVRHLTTSIAVAGTITITVDGQLSEWNFSVTGQSTDDPAYSGLHVKPQGRGNYTEMEARKAAQALLIAELDEHRREVFASRAAKALDVARTAVAAGQVLEADQAFYVAAKLLARSRSATATTTTMTKTTNDGTTTTTTSTTNLGPSGPPKEMIDWMLVTHRMPADALTAALVGKSLPTLDLIGEHRVASIDLPITLADYEALNDYSSGRFFTRLLSMGIAAGPALTNTDTTASTGGLIMGQLSVNPDKKLFGLRTTAGSLGAGGGHTYVDVGFTGGYGLLRTRGLWLGPVFGVGGDLTTGSEESIPTAELFTVRPGLYAEYGARLSYVFPKNGKLELQYSKAFRSTTYLAAEKRAEGSFYYHGLGPSLMFTARYTEYLPDVDSFFGTFSSNGRLARSTWILGGFGF